MSKRLLLSAMHRGAPDRIAANAAHAQSFPNRPIRIIVAFPPGGATDVIARTVGTPLGQRLGQNVVVDNRPGSNGNISAELAANARPDGHTLLLGSDSLWGINPHLYSRMPVDLRKAFVPVTNLITNQIILTVNPDKVPSKTLPEFVEFARKANPPLFYASIGNGSQHHIAMELLKLTAKINLTHVPYKGGGPAGIATVAGETVAMFGGGSVVPLVRSGKLRALAVSSSKRSPVLAGAADHRRVLSRLRGHDLAGPVRADRYAARRHRQAAHRDTARCCKCRTSPRSCSTPVRASRR